MQNNQLITLEEINNLALEISEICTINPYGTKATCLSLKAIYRNEAKYFILQLNERGELSATINLPPLCTPGNTHNYFNSLRSPSLAGVLSNSGISRRTWLKKHGIQTIRDYLIHLLHHPKYYNSIESQKDIQIYKNNILTYRLGFTMSIAETSPTHIQLKTRLYNSPNHDNQLEDIDNISINSEIISILNNPSITADQDKLIIPKDQFLNTYNDLKEYKYDSILKKSLNLWLENFFTN